jgi:hypothetical protein
MRPEEIEAPGEADEIALGVLGADVVIGVPAIAVLMWPSVVLTPLNGAQLAARLPEPVVIGKCLQPAPSTARQQERPSLTTLLPAMRSRLYRLTKVRTWMAD